MVLGGGLFGVRHNAGVFLGFRLTEVLQLPPSTDRARAYSGEFDDRPFVRVTRHTNPLFTAGLDRTFKSRKSQKVACSMADAEKSDQKTESMCALLDVTARTRHRTGKIRRDFFEPGEATPKVSSFFDVDPCNADARAPAR